jgi:hypothetical protein
MCKLQRYQLLLHGVLTRRLGPRDPHPEGSRRGAGTPRLVTPGLVTPDCALLVGPPFSRPFIHWGLRRPEPVTSHRPQPPLRCRETSQGRWISRRTARVVGSADRVSLGRRYHRPSSSLFPERAHLGRAYEQGEIAAMRHRGWTRFGVRRAAPAGLGQQKALLTIQQPLALD